MHAFERCVRRDSTKATKCHLHPFVQRHPPGFKDKEEASAGLPWERSLPGGEVARDSTLSPSLGSAPEQGGQTPTWALERLGRALK